MYYRVLCTIFCSFLSVLFHTRFPTMMVNRWIWRWRWSRLSPKNSVSFLLFCRPFSAKKVFGLEMFPTCVSSEHCALFLLCTSELLASRRGSPRAFPPLAHTPCSGCTSFYPGYIHKSSILEFGYRPSCIWQGWRFSILNFKKVRRNMLMQMFMKTRVDDTKRQKWHPWCRHGLIYNVNFVLVGVWYCMYI